MASLRLDQLYVPSSSEKVIDLEAELEHELAELCSELETNEMHHGIIPKITSTVPLPKDIAYFRHERSLVIQRAMQVSEAQPLRSQAEEMQMEMRAAETCEYTEESLPLLLQQYFLDRIHSLVQSKHLYMLRWRRFCEHTSTIENMYPHYHQCLTVLMNEYKDCLQRAQRLSAVREAHISGKGDIAMQAVTMEDLLIYLRWLVCHLHAIKHFNQYLRVLQWLPISHKLQFASQDGNAEQEEVSNASKIASRYQDESTYSQIQANACPPSASAHERAHSPVPPPPPVSLALLSTAPLPSSSMIYAAAASGGGLASNEQTLGLPMHSSDLNVLRPQLAFTINLYGVNFDLSSIHSTAEEMELFALVNRKFKHFFIKQEHLMTFRTYDHVELGSESWGTDSSNHALLKECNWLPYVTLTPKNDPYQQKRWTELRQADKTDEILRYKAHFLKVKDTDKVQAALKEHARAVHDPPQVQAASVTSHHTPNHTRETWKKIYSNSDLYTNNEVDQSGNFQDIDERDANNANFNTSSRSANIRKSRDSYDYANTVQMLGLDDGDQSSNDPVTVHGSYLSFLHLRHLRIRDLQRTCLSILNYFRSVERTLTINDGGLSLEGDSVKRNCVPNHRQNTEMDGTLGGSGGLGSHAYLHNTPVDFKVSEVEFMEFGDVENHDDFYSVEEGRIHVQDQQGYYIMYSAAIDDMRNLEKDLLLMATHFIEKDKEHRMSVLRGSESSRRGKTNAGDFDIASYAHQDVDRFGILLDVWTNEAAFLERKRELLDCYFEAYQHVTDRDERRGLAQTITNVMHRRPRFDFQAAYFVRTYRTECTILQLESRLVKSILDKQIEEQREYTQRVCREGEALFGLPSRVIPKQPISVNLSRPALKNVYMLEFHPTLAIARHIPEAIQYANWELQQIHKPETIYDSLMLEKQLFEVAQKEWDNMPGPGKSYSAQMDKDLFSGTYVEDPLFICELAQHLVAQQEQQSGTRRSHKDRQLGMLQAAGMVMETVTLRYRLIDAAWEAALLSEIYVRQAKDMGYDAAHLNLRLVQFEYASHRPAAAKPPPIFITAIQDNDSAVDKYSPSHCNLGIHELDESHVGRFSFRSRDGLLQVLRPGGVESLQVVVKTQVVHKNALTAAVLQASTCQPVRPRQVGKSTSGRASPTETKSERSSQTQATGVSSAGGPTSLGSRLPGLQTHVQKAPEAFMSLQLEKTPSRDLMLNDFVQKKQQMGSVLKNPEELEKLKRKGISDYCERFHIRLSHTSMRAQLLAYYNSLLSLLEDFPAVRDTYFIIGEPNEKKSNMDDLEGLTPDPRTLKKRPRRLLSQDGRHVLNLWFIPHYTEVLIMFKHLDDDDCYRALAFCLTIISSLHDLLQYLCAFSRLGSSHARLGSRRVEFVSADWGGTEGIGSELREIQKHVDVLPQPTDPDAVQQLLWLRRDVMFLEFETAVRHCMTDTFLSAGNMQAYQSINTNMRHALAALSNVQRRGLFCTNVTIPEPLEARDIRAQKLFPWRTFLNTNGPFPGMFWQWSQISHNIQLCLAGLREVDRHVANGEILGVTLLMEDVLQTGFQGAIFHQEHQEHQQAESQASHVQSASREQKEATKTVALMSQKSLSRSQQPLESYRLLRFFLLLWKCLELAKADWGRRKLSVESVSTTALYRDFSKHYRVEVLVPVLQSVARRLGQGDMYDAIIPETDILVMPAGASEIEVRAKQLVRLLETLECHMITEVQKRVNKELTLALSERARGEGALPTDLWKRAVMKESFTTNRPHLAEQFVDDLMSKADESETQVTVGREHLRGCLASLARSVMAREKQNYESYTMYYENLLRANNQLLYQREQEIKHLKDQLKEAQQATTVEVQFQMAARTHDLIMEVTALRAKILEMREQSMTQEQDVRERVKREFKDLVQSMFNAHFQLRARFDEFRAGLRDDVMAKINETRGEAVLAMTKLAEKFGSVPDDDLQVNQQRAEKLRDLQQENHQLSTLLLKVKAMNSWRRNHLTDNYLKTIVDLRKEAEVSKKETLEVRMLAEEQVVLLKQQLVAIRRALANTERESNDLRRLLDKELKQKEEKEHELMQKERSKSHLEQAKQASIERLMEELNDKDRRLRKLSEEQDRSTRLQSMTQEKVRKDVDFIKKQLSHERTLKLGAFHRVDELQSQVYELESNLFAHSPHGTASIPPTPAKSTRAVSASKVSRKIRPSTTSGVWPPPTAWPATRMQGAPEEGALGVAGLNNMDNRMVQRPKTVGGRLRSRIAEQLLNELEPDHHRIIVQLEQLQLEGRR